MESEGKFPSLIRAVGSYVRIGLLVAATALALTGCETSGETRSKVSVDSLPEFAEHHRCLGRQTFTYSKAEGSPLELGIIASSACGSTRYALYNAIAKIEGRAYAQGYITASEREDPKMIAGAIIKVRQGQSPF